MAPLYVMVANIILGLKRLELTKTLAYYSVAIITVVKSFIG